MEEVNNTSRHPQRRAFYVGWSYSLIALAGTWGFNLPLLLEITAGARIWLGLVSGSLLVTMLLGLIRAFPPKIRLSILELQYLLFPFMSILLVNADQWSPLRVVGLLVALMLTFMAVRTMTMLLLLTVGSTFLTALLLLRAGLTGEFGSSILLTLFAVVIGGSFMVAWQRQMDQADREKGDVALRKSKDLLRGIIESSADWIFAVNPAGVLISANGAFLAHLRHLVGMDMRLGDRLSLDRVIGKNADEIVQKVLAGERQVVRIKGRNGEVFELVLQPVWSGDQIQAMAGMARDLTDLIALQERIRQNRERYENAIAGSNDGIWEWDLEKQTVYVSDRWKEMLGMEPDDFGLSREQFAVLMHPEDLPVIMGIFEGHIKTGKQMLAGEFRMRHLDGSYRWFAGRGRAVRNSDGRVIRISGSMTDISDRKKNELELHKLSLVASRTSNTVVITDANGKIEWVNEGFTRTTGYELEEVKGKAPGSFLQGPETDPATRQLIRERISQRLPVSTEILNYHKNGGTYWISMEINPIFDKQGKLVNFIAIESDITPAKQQEAQLREAKHAAEQAAKAKSEFLATMSHEIRTPMNAVIGMTGLLLDSNLEEEQREFVETIRISGDNLLTIINDILDFSKIDAGHMELEQHPFSLSETIEDVLDLLSSRAQSKNLELTYEGDPNTPVDLIADPTRLNQVLVNLVGNAIKFTSEGEIVISVKEVQRIGSVSKLQFSVRDTGIGIPADKIRQLFLPFTQVDASTTRKFGGTGLGLAISAKLVQLMGGDIWAESELGKGSVFHFTLRVKRQSEETFRSATLKNHPPLQTKARVLVVDDNHTNLHILERLLQTWELEPTLCDHPLDALRLTETGRFDLMLLDMHMPDMDGLELARALHQRLGEQTPPLVMITSLGQGVQGVDKQLFAAFLHKPIRREQLYKHISRALGQGTQPELLPADTREEEEAVQMPKLSVLVAEDNLVNQKVARRMLQKLGYEPEIVANGEEAVDMVHRRNFDLVFMDMRMPVMDGLEATRKIREKLGSRGPVICAMTANAMLGDREECLAAGMDDYITKPVKIEAIQEAILRNFPVGKTAPAKPV